MDAAQDSNPAKLFVGNLPYGVTSDQLKEKFSLHGTVVEAIVMTDKFTGRSKGFGFVTMSTPEEAQEAVTGLNESEWESRRIVVNVARPRVPREQRGFGGGNRGGFNRGGRDFRHSNNDRGGWNN